MVASHSSNSFYQRRSVFRRDSSSAVNYVASDWVNLYDSGALEYDSEITEFKISITAGTPLTPRHRILVLSKSSTIPTVSYPYVTALASPEGEDTVSADTVGPFPTIKIPQGSSFIIQIFATDDDTGTAQATLDSVEVQEQR